jgi:hypothetical protein
MLADKDHPMDSSNESGPAADPQVVVVYRSRGVPWLLMPALLLFSAVVAIVVYRKIEKPEFPMVIPSAPISLAAANADLTPAEIEKTKIEPVSPTGTAPAIAPGERAPVETSIVKPLVPKREASRFDPPDLSTRPAIPGEDAPVETAPPKIDAEPVPAPAAEPAPPPLLAKPLEPANEPVKQPEPAKTPDPAPAAAPVGFDPAAAKTVAAELAAPDGDKPLKEFAEQPGVRDLSPPIEAPGTLKRPPSEEALDRQQRDAERRLFDRAGLNEGRPDLLNTDPNDVGARRHDLYRAALRIASQDRQPFHDDLKKVLAELKLKAGPEIQKLCTRYGRDTMPEIHGVMNRDLLGPSSRLSVGGRIERMRDWGVPETIVLDDLFESQKKRIGERGGPRNQSEAWVRAAWVLVKYPPKAPTGKAAKVEAKPEK